MPNPKTGSNRWVPDIRPDKVETATETNGEQSEQYRIVDAHPILGGILDKLAYFRTHAGAVWYNKLAGITVLQKLDNLASNIGVLAQLATTDKTSLVAAINTLSSQIDSLNSHHFAKANGNIKFDMNGIYIGKFGNGPTIPNSTGIFDSCIYIIGTNNEQTAAYVFTIGTYSAGHIFFNRMTTDNLWQLSPWKQLL